MDSNKINPQVQLALRYENLFAPAVRAQFVVDSATNTWELIVEYVNDMNQIQQALDLSVYYLNNNFAIVTIRREDIGPLTDHPNVVFISFSVEMSYISVSLTQICATNVSNPKGVYNLTGSGTLIGIIDTGIDYMHPDFIGDNQQTRISFIWDQTIAGGPPAGFPLGTEYTAEQINTALAQPTREAQLQVVPTQDQIGHGTAMAGIAAGNGRGGNGQYVGVAPECQLVIVKIGPEGGTSASPTSKDIMIGIKYVLEKGLQENKPVSLLLGVGSNIAAHDGRSVLERYIDQMSAVWKSNFVVGTGNQANKGSHASDRVNNNESQVVQFFIDKNLVAYQCSIWKQFVDQIEIVVESPQGEQTESLGILTPNRAFIFGNTVVMVNFSLASINSTRQEIFIWLQAITEEGIDQGIWTLILRGIDILDGAYNIWGSIIEDVNNQTRFLAEEPNVTLTIPSTTYRITSVAAFNGPSSQIAPFSGRGYTTIGEIKPDITAPGVNVMTASIRPESLYESVSGTSASAAFVAGAYAILLQYSIVLLGEQYIYGESLKLYMLRNAKRLPVHAPYPNNQWGYGVLCIEQILNNMAETLTAL
jgi:subtilisin family serine protease